jgi:1,4-alpha-glucan branching enzyme
MVKYSPKTGKTTFQVTVPEAISVFLVGDFNHWNTSAAPLKKNRTGVWKTQMALSPGKYEFLYFVDGQRWIPDNEAPQVNNPYGSRNSVLEIPERVKSSNRKKLA